MRSACLSLALLALLCASGVAARDANSSQTTSSGQLFQDLGIDVAQKAEAALMSYSPSRLPMTSTVARRMSAEDACGECVGKTAKHIIESILEEVNKQCANVTCPVIKQRCDWIADHEEEYAGVVYASVRPGSLGWSYCLGTGECKHPNVTSWSSLVDFGRSDATQFYNQLAAVDGIIAKAMESKELSPEERKMLGEGGEYRLGQKPESRLMSLFDRKESNGEELQGEKRCHRCLKKGIKWLLKRSIKKLIHKCRATKCPKFKEFCKWAKEHKEFVRGVIYVRTTPYRTAKGYCYGRGDCKCRREVSSFPFAVKPKKEKKSLLGRHEKHGRWGGKRD